MSKLQTERSECFSFRRTNFFFLENASLITNIFCCFFSIYGEEQKEKFSSDGKIMSFASNGMKRARWEEHLFWHNQKSFVCLLHDERNVFSFDFVFEENYVKSSRSVLACGDANTRWWGILKFCLIMFKNKIE